MALRNFPYLFLFVFLFLTYLVVNQYQSAPVIKYPNLNPGDLFPQAERFISLINRSQDIVGRFRCLKGWKQFGGSCYHPSIMKSTPDKANQTCSRLHVNNTHLMRIRHSVELSYAAHIFFTRNLRTLLVETDPQLFKSKIFMDMVSANDRAEWQMIEDKLYQARLEFKPKTKSSDFTNGDKKNNRNENDHIYSSDEDNDAFERFNDIRRLCDQFAWNVFNNDSHIFTFTTYKILDKLVCSLSDVNLNLTYEHVCQYVLNFCFGNVMCGKHGQCVNSLEGFKCSCSFFFNGVLCEKFAHQIIEMIIGGIIIFILWSLLLIIKICTYYNNKKQLSNGKPNRQKTTSNGRQNRQNTTSNRRSLWEVLKKKFERNSFIRSILVGILGLVFFSLLLVIPTVFQFRSFPSFNIDPLKSQSVIDEMVSVLKKCKRKSFIPIDDRIFLGIPMDDWIFLGISIVLIIFFILATRWKQKPTEDHSLSRHSSRSSLSEEQDSETNRQGNGIRLEPLDRESQAVELTPLLEAESSGGPPRTTQEGASNPEISRLLEAESSGGPPRTTPEGTSNPEISRLLETESSGGPPRTTPEGTSNPEISRLLQAEPSGGPPRTTRQEVSNPETEPLLGPHSSDGTPLSSLVTPFVEPKRSWGFLSSTDPYYNINRYVAPAIFGILTFEILKFFNEILLSISGGSDDGVLIILLKRIIVVSLIGSRYYPTLVSLRLQHPIVHFLAFAHVIGIIIYTIYRESLCLDFLPHSENFSELDEVKLRIKLGTWFIIYGLIVNLPHFALLSYIGAELGTRLMFDSRYGYQQKNEIKHLPKSHQETHSPDADPADGISFFQKCLDKVYRWDEDFLFTAMTISTYAVNFIILFHLACTFSFLYTTRMMSPISFLTNSFEQMFNIEIKDRLFHTEIIFSAIITALIYSIQLFLCMKNFKEKIKQNCEKDPKLLLKEREIEEKEALSRAIQYPGYLIRYTVGGFVITFHLLIFVIFIFRQSLRYYYAFKWILEVILPILILYALQSLIAKGISKLLTVARNQRDSEVNNTVETSSPRNSSTCCSQFGRDLKNILQYFILVANCFIGIASSIDRLITGLAFNIFTMNRIDFGLFPEPWENRDHANVAYWCFLYEEIYFMQHEQPYAQEASPTEPSHKVEKPGDKAPRIGQPEEYNSTDRLANVDRIQEINRRYGISQS